MEQIHLNQLTQSDMALSMSHNIPRECDQKRNITETLYRIFFGHVDLP